MSLHAILQTIRDSGKVKVREIEARAYAQTREIMTNARLEAESIRERACAETVEPAIRERARLIQRARMEALQTVGEARETLVDASMEQCRGRLAGVRAESTYPQVFRQLIQETLTELERSQIEQQSAKTACLEADPRDQKVLERLLDEMDLRLEVNYSLECWGGLIARSEDSRVAVINTLEARLDRATPYLRRYLAALFENEQPEFSEVRDKADFKKNHVKRAIREKTR
ncbi:MAG: V-type ATP synthase subunit E family protein [Anaerolineales bacterium]|jgi:vacuolar-type H+-ATPase subunit E/Vma4